MSRKKRNLVVSFNTPAQAQAALEAAKDKFGYKNGSPCTDLDHCDGSKLIWGLTDSVSMDHDVKQFLYSQEGALPEGVHA